MSSTDTEASLLERVAALEKQVDFLSKERPGRKMKPNLKSSPGVCGLDPHRDSTTCPDASIYRYQQGCQGDKCVKINHDYYAEYRAKRKKENRPLVEAVVEVDFPLVDTNGDGGEPEIQPRERH